MNRIRKMENYASNGETLYAILSFFALMEGLLFYAIKEIAERKINDIGKFINSIRRRG